jgi:hypothetical protein
VRVKSVPCKWLVDEPKFSIFGEPHPIFSIGSEFKVRSPATDSSMGRGAPKCTNSNMASLIHDQFFELEWPAYVSLQDRGIRRYQVTIGKGANGIWVRFENAGCSFNTLRIHNIVRTQITDIATSGRFPSSVKSSRLALVNLINYSYAITESLNKLSRPVSRTIVNDNILDGGVRL